MPGEIHIDELHTTHDSVSAQALLTPELLARIVAAVRDCERVERQRRQDREADLDTRSVVDQQRAGRR
ncbi:hypothetical protein [Flexivirga alba]|uniref:Uncharacterized protein n=1 Tax=Flexivirga alba TaxID=702742 RepID=A0ABW2AGE8_9MICO